MSCLDIEMSSFSIRISSVEGHSFASLTDLGLTELRLLDAPNPNLWRIQDGDRF